MKQTKPKMKETKNAEVRICVMDFIKSVITEKLLSASDEKVRAKYLADCKLKSPKNVDRVMGRVLSKERAEKVNQWISENKIDRKELEQTCNQLVVKIRGKKANNFI